jgi:arylsulfatase A-like enzyme
MIYPTDLSISLSSTDYVGHTFGPASLESEENLLRLDKTLADLFAFVDKTVGLKHTLIVLSADHGTPEAAEYLSAKGFNAGRVNVDTLDYSVLEVKLKQQFGIGKEVIKKVYPPYVYLDHALIEKNKLELADVSRLIAQELIEVEGIGYAISSADLVAGRVPDAPISRQVLHNFSPKRSGDIYIIYEPQWGATGNGDVALVNHGSPWRYDTFVPIVFAGNKISAQRINLLVETTDIAPTLSDLLGLKPPSGSIGVPLHEVLIK